MTQVRPRAAVLATLGAVAIATSAYLDWFVGRPAQQFPVTQLLLRSGEAPTEGYWGSLAAPLAVAGAIGVIGALLLSRLLLWLAFLLGLATVVLWVLSETTVVAPAGFQILDTRPGAWVAAAGVIVVLLGTAALRARVGVDDEGLAAEGPAADGGAERRGEESTGVGGFDTAEVDDRPGAHRVTERTDTTP